MNWEDKLDVALLLFAVGLTIYSAIKNDLGMAALALAYAISKTRYLELRAAVNGGAPHAD